MRHLVKAQNVSQLGAFLKDDLSREIERLADIRLPLYNSTTSATLSTPVALPGFTGTMPDLPIASGSNSNYHSPPITPLRKRPIEEVISTNTSPTKLLITASDQSLAASLPLLSKFLLIASYFASFNSAKSDVIHFVRLDEGIAKKGTKAKKAVVKKPGTLLKVSFEFLFLSIDNADTIF